MRKQFKRFWVLLLACTFLLPLGIAAIDTDQKQDGNFEKMISRTKELFGVGEDYKEFYYQTNTWYGEATYSLTWSQSKTEKPDVSVTIGMDGFVYHYNHDCKVPTNTKIPVLTKAEALDIAYATMQKVAPEAEKYLSKNAAYSSYFQYSGYTIQFPYIVNGETVAGAGLYMTIDPFTGEICEYDAGRLPRNLQIPEPQEKLTEEALLAAFQKNIPFELIYRTVYDDNGKATVKLQYVLNKDYSNAAIDATTGERISISYVYKNDNGGIGGGSPLAEPVKEDAMINEVERDVVERQKKFLTVEQALEKLSAIPEFKMTNPTVFDNQYSYRTSPYTNEVTYLLMMRIKSDENEYVNCTFNAETSELIRFTNENSYGYQEPEKFLYTEEECKEAGIAFCEKYYADKFANTKYEENSYVVYREDTATDGYYTFRYVRYNNDIRFTDSITVTVYADTKEVAGFSQHWSDATFPAPKNIISADKAAENYVSVFPITTSYLPVSKREENKATIVYYSNENVLLPLVSMYTNYGYIDAFNGKVLDYSGDVYVYTPEEYYTPIAFDDIDGHAAQKQIETISNMDIIPYVGSYQPDTAVTQQEWIQILQNMGQYSYVTPLMPENNAKPFPKPNKKGTLTREIGVKMMIEALGYAEIADLPSIFLCGYADDAKIAVENYGYIALAKGMGLLKDEIGEDNQFLPNKVFTRADAAILVYNYFLNQK